MNKKYLHNNKEGGYAVMTALLFFLASTAAVVASLSDGALREVHVVRNESFSKQSYYASESAAEDAVYRIKNNLSIDSTEMVTVASSSASVSIVDNGDNTKTIRSDGDVGGTKRTTEIGLNVGTGLTIDYALQTGVGGVDLLSGVDVIGDIYTTGSINGCGGCSISGAAIAAGTSTLSLDQSNTTPDPANQSIIFGDSTNNQDLSQSFVPSTDLSIMKLELFIKKIGNPSNATIKITKEKGGKPDFYNPIASGTLSSSLVSTTYTWINIPLTAVPVLESGDTYWIVIDANANTSNYYEISANTGYVNGQAKIGRGDINNGWNNTSPSGLDAYFKIYLSSADVGISGEDQYNKMSVGSAYARQVSFVNATGNIYCQIGGNNNKPCDESRSDPVFVGLPIALDAIDFWKSEAVSGTTTSGNISVGSTGSTLGPRKIVGNLSVGSGGTLRVSGTLWVTGSVTINGGGTVTSADSSKSFVIISDSNISLSGGAQITGGTNHHIMLLSTSSSDPAVTINGGANDTIASAPYGGILFTGGAAVSAGIANHITIDGGADVVYSSDLSQLNFSSGSSGDTFNIESWKETE
ncbi:MAG: hypothetical protein COV01_00425 [Candidatus Taylorbacteria bacterium CG10_big_fil_rev_8_21_14_0_10_41_48]|uniref:Type 4 fimbrial biogenesis protein PilX N-terminal domain-containing protein n=1 Tax=Candidatus Taylorbacteria bacterium CG10_big_fil_rev_8_21_14_0_10_41_48 TaxID=1975024 RepID=A0A2M8LCY3_9BACT|nr:MAG: hypothetical protein COV01_00425 [Candidatus Taylorbacteria bacterium CG10_big_fil_rev_8_21_14_0_10_41_48]